MSSDSGMTPEKARKTLEIADPLNEGWDIADARAFLEGVAYQEEKAKGLVEAIEPFLNGQHDLLTNGYGIDHHEAAHCSVCKLQQALAHYRQGE